MFVVDASIWVSYFLKSDRHHSRTVAWVNGIIEARDPLAAPILLLLEVAGAVARRSGEAHLGSRAAAQVAGFRAMTLSMLDETLAALAARAFLRGSDATYVALALRLSCPLVTWDAQQRDRAMSVV